ncbi:MAG: FAD-dependent oxidoreductase [Alphaproteobacteria bacterium GM7ARS4]|nr:FAD-dependent oxidoreductase [Alphaproteobacteria bacterium GM7ARS4]
MHGCHRPSSSPHIAIVGAGFGGATVARYVKTYHPDIRITLIEQSPVLHTCPFSNYVLAGFKRMDDITWTWDGLKNIGCDTIRGKVIALDAHRKTLTIEHHGTLRWDRLVLSPGIDMQWDAIDGYGPETANLMPHAWKAGEQTLLLKKQIDSMEDGGTMIITAPEMPYRCPPAPYERASVLAWYLKRHKPRSKIIILDGKKSFTKKALFEEGWKALYPAMIEWVPADQGGHVVAVSPQDRAVITADGRLWHGDVINVIPPQTAGTLALEAGLAPHDEWCQIHPVTFESQEAKNIHIIGDSTVAGAMPKSAFAANSQGKAVALALSALLDDNTPSYPLLMNTCYSLLAPDYGISVAASYRPSATSIVAIHGGSGTSPLQASQAFRKKEADYAHAWYQQMLSEIYG